MTLAPSGIITLLTDFGTEDPFVGVMKGVVVSRFAAARVIDLSHAIAPQHRVEASFWLSRCIPWFPVGTVHVAVVDPGVGTERAPLAARIGEQWLVLPDNGLLWDEALSDSGTVIHRIEPGRLGLSVPSHTFHGRDVFAPVAAELASGRLRLDQVGPVHREPQPAVLPRARYSPHEISGEVVVCDHFGNLVTNIDGAKLTHLVEPQITLGEASLPLSRTYADVADGAEVALVNSFGVLEIALRNASAKAQWGLDVGASVLVRARERS